MWLLDTDVMSATAPTKMPRPDLAGWMDANSSGLFISAVTVAEIVDGIAKLRRDGATRKASLIGAWFDTVTGMFESRVLPLDLTAARAAGELLDRARSRGALTGFADAAIAGTAAVHGLTILTRNVRHYEAFGVPFLDPYRQLPEAGIGSQPS